MNIQDLKLDHQFYKPHSLGSIEKLGLTHLAFLLWSAPIEEVRKAIVAVFKEGRVGVDHKSFQGGSKDLQEYHKLLQATVCAVANEDITAGISVLKRYLRASARAYTTDLSYPGDAHLASGRMLTCAISFAARLFVCRGIKGFDYGKTDHNPLCRNSELFAMLLEFLYEDASTSSFISGHRKFLKQGRNLVLRFVTRVLLKSFVAQGAWMANEVFLELDGDTLEQNWSVCEMCFRYAIRHSNSSSHRFPQQAELNLKKTAFSVLRQPNDFEVDEEFGNLQRDRALGVCFRYLWQLHSSDIEKYIATKAECHHDIAEMNGEEALKEYEFLADALRSVPSEDVRFTPSLFKRRDELAKHISCCVSFQFPLSQGGPILR